MTPVSKTQVGSRLDQGVQKTAQILGFVLSGVVIVYAYAVVSAPIDAVQGVIQKILYAIYLWKGSEACDRLAIAGAEVGLIFCTLMMITGPIWAKGTWGHWWSWDPRLTVTLLLWFIYLAYLLLRGFTEPGPRASRFAAVYGILGPC